MKLDIASPHTEQFPNEVIHVLTLMNGQLADLWNALDAIPYVDLSDTQREMHRKLQVALDSV